MRRLLWIGERHPRKSTYIPKKVACTEVADDSVPGTLQIVRQREVCRRLSV